MPGLHLVTTWGLPLLGIVLAVRAARTRAVLRDTQGTCPARQERIALPTLSVGAAAAAAPCPRCGRELHLHDSGDSS